MGRIFSILCIAALCVGLAFMSIFLIQSCRSRTASGNMLTDIRRVDAFNRVAVQGIDNLVITQANEMEVKVTADDNIIGQILTYVRDGRLVVDNRKTMRQQDITVKISMPDIKCLEIWGSVKAEIPNTLRCGDLDVNVAGSGSVDISDIRCSGKLNIVSNGSANITVSGESQVLRCKNEGAGNVFAERLRSDNIYARLYGSGSMFVTSNGALSVLIAGSGSLAYYGEPAEIQKQITGTGSITKRN